MREKQAFISALLAANLVAAFTLKDETKQSILKLWLAKGSAAEHCSIGPELQYSPNTKLKDLKCQNFG
ncbi:unnamed protein product [Oikopleura dioica]|uniref:Uncharacterized protein n=1 Tax=Oikopleura dioica TaxID=34765 RepID=E4WY85_OIKDI|nr:unnamed protein product [Oikopleura dioica]